MGEIMLLILLYDEKVRTISERNQEEDYYYCFMQ